jgi:hypothetical protein
MVVKNHNNPHMTWEYELHVDLVHGFTVPRFEVRHTWLDRPSSSRTGYLSEVKWEEVSGVYVPVWHRVTSYDYDPKQPPAITEMNLSWTHINERLDDRRFSADGFDAPDEVGVVDARLAKPVVLKPSRWRRPLAPIPPVPSRTRLYLLLSVGNAALVLGIVTFLYLRRRKERSEVRPGPIQDGQTHGTQPNASR